MLVIISPAKSLDFNRKIECSDFTLPENLDRSKLLVSNLKNKSRKKIMELMSISKDLAQLNLERYNEWQLPFNEDNAKQAIFVFKGDVYIGLDIDKFLQEDLIYTQDHLRILSGLHGLLRPLDLIQPYRLEMGTRLQYRGKNNLYQFWGDLITKAVQQALDEQEDNVIINLASDEYFKSVNTKKLNARIITPVFMDFKNGEYKFLSFFFKKARGMMARYILLNRINSIDGLKLFNEEGYFYNENLSEGDKLVFTRD
jgi:cytoplasmic iron level regulating protein YaaA (DUF328/UPF0246 family)